MRNQLVSNIALLLVLVGGFVPANATAQLPQPTAQGVNQNHRLIFLVDRSGSMKDGTPPETTQSVILNYLELAALADQQLEVLVITFGAQVKVFGADDGQPTAAYETLAKRLVTDWPEAEGGTPMDAAFEVAANVCRKSENTPTTVVLLSDGMAGSGHLRPEHFPEIRKAIDQRRAAILKSVCDACEAIKQERLYRYEADLRNPESDDFLKLIDQQHKLELPRTLNHAKALRQQSVRFVTVDLTGIPWLEELHKEAGGTSEDLVRAQPDRVLEALHKRGTCVFPGIVQLPKIEVPARAMAFDHTVEVRTDAVGDGVFIAIEFHPAIPDFETNAALTAEADGQTWQFDVANPAPETVVGRDAKGSVASLSLRLPFVPKNDQIRIHFESPNGSLTVPEFTVYPFLKLREDLVADFRPSHLPTVHQPPFQISASQAAEWSFGLQTKDGKQTFSLASTEAIARSGSRQVRMALAPSPDYPNRVVSKPNVMPVGVWDVDLNVQLKSGVQFQLALRRHIVPIIRDEAVLISFPNASDKDASLVSNARSHLDFGQLGDERTERTLEMLLESSEFDGPISIVLESELSDTDGNVPVSPWIRFSRNPITLQPGRQERVRVTLAMPAQIGSAIVDGPMEGLFRVRLADAQFPLPLKRPEKIAGVPDDAPVSRITCELKRPRLQVALPRAWRDWVITQNDEECRAVARIDINQRYQRVLVVEITHNSILPRDITALPLATVLDDEGRSVPSLRLVPASDTELTQTISPGAVGTWEFAFEADRDCKVTEAIAGVDISGEGIVSQHLTVEIRRRDPLLAGWIVFACWALFGLILLLLVLLTLKLLKNRRLRTEQETTVTTKSPLSDLLALESPTPKRVVVVPAVELRQVTDNDLRRAKRFREDQQVPIRPQEISEQNPLRLTTVAEGDPTVVEITEIEFDDDGQPEAHLRVIEGGAFDARCSQLASKMVRYGVVAAICLLVATGIDHPGVIRVLQWTWDAVFFV